MFAHVTRRGLPFVIALAMTSALVFGCGQPSQPPASQSAPAAAPAPTVQSAVERGKYLTTIGGCHDCHTPKNLGPNGPEPDMTKMLSGHPEAMKMPAPPKIGPSDPWAIVTNPMLTAWNGPWGVSFAANLTPDQNTGLGIWTEDMFMTAIRQGKHMGVSRPILPPMPWQAYATMPDEDLKAVWAFLRSIPPITNHVPDPIPAAGAK
jgi:mono/diheme cytochrome c family protein